MKRLLLFLVIAACVDPVHDEEVDAEGPEVAGVEEGPLHRPGSPCTTCHGERGPGEPEISVGGTVFLAWNSDAGANGATVTVTDARDAGVTLTTNEVGNFFATKGDYDPVYPLRVKIEFEGQSEEMKTLVRRDGGCGRCHRSNGDSSHTLRIYVPGRGPTP
jgi:hypothetical protein